MTALVYDNGPLRWTACKVAGLFAPGVFWSRLGGLRLRQVPVPELPSPEWVRLRPILGGICGTDLAVITQRHHPANILQAFSSLPAVVGHENVSIVEEVGPAVTRWRPGDRVVVESALSCVPRGISPLCPACAAGRFTLCDNFREGPLPPGSMIGWNAFTGGSWAPCFVAHESQLYRVPEAMTDEEALLTDPIAGALHAILRHPPPAGANVLILGAGLLGMGVAAAIRAMEGGGPMTGLESEPVDPESEHVAAGRHKRCRVTAIIRHDRQRELMQRYGVDETVRVSRKDAQGDRYRRVAERIGGQVIPTRFGHNAFVGGFDIVYDCVGTGESLTDAMKYARAGGTVVELGTSQITLVDTAPLWFDELTLVGANGRAFEEYDGRRMHTYDVVFDLVRQKRLDLSGLLTHRFKIEDYRQAFATLANRSRSGAIKVAFEQRV